MSRHRLKQRGAPWLFVEGLHHRVSRPDTGINGRCREGTLQKDGGADQKERRCADLDRDQGTSRTARPRVLGQLAAHRSHQLEARGLQRRRVTEGRRRNDRAP